MATPVELAVIELQILVREFNRRLGGLERRLGVEPEPHTPRTERVGGHPVHRPLDPPPRSERVSEAAAADLYEMAAPQRAVPPMPESPPAAPPTVQETLLTDMRVNTAPLSPPEETPSSEVIAGIQEELKSKPAPAGVASEIPLGPQGSPERPPSAAKVMEFLRTYESQRPPEDAKRRAIELTIGTWAASWIAALAIMGGVLFFLKLAMDNGDLYLSPLVRIGMALAAGAALILHGTWCHVKQFRALATGLSAAGIAVLMTTIFSAHLAFDPPVLSQMGAFAAIPLVAILGMVMAYATRSPILAFISYFALYLSPQVLQTDLAVPYLHVPYLLAVTCLGLILGARIRPWEVLRVGAFTMGWVAMAGWVVSDAAKIHGQFGFIFICAFFVLFLGEMCRALLRANAADPSASPRLTEQAGYHDSVAAIFSAINSGVAVLLCFWLFQQAHLLGDWAFALALSVLMALLARIIRSASFSTSAVFQSFVLLGVAACLALYGSHITGSFAIFAILFAVFAAIYNSPVARVWMFVFLSVTAVRIFIFDSNDSNLQRTLYAPAGVAISAWMIMAWAAALLSLFLGWLSRPWAKRQKDSTTIIAGDARAAVGCIMISTALVTFVNHQALPHGDAFTLASVLWIFVLTLLMRARSLAEISQALETVTSALLMVLCIKWFIFDGVGHGGRVFPPEMWPLLNPFTVNAILLAIAVLCLRPLRAQPDTNRRFVGWWLFAIGFFLLNVEAVRGVERLMTEPIPGIGSLDLVQNVTVTILWSLTALVMLGVGFIVKSTSVRYVALALFAMTTLKTLLVDMANMQSILRVLSLMTLGIVLFVVSYLYHKASTGSRLSTPQG